MEVLVYSPVNMNHPSHFIVCQPMKNYTIFKQIKWNRNRYEILSVSKGHITICFQNVHFSERPNTSVTIEFVMPSYQWSIRWDKTKELWKVHYGLNLMKNNKIINSYIYLSRFESGKKLKINFSVSHEMGISLWGFIFSSFRIISVTQEKVLDDTFVYIS